MNKDLTVGKPSAVLWKFCLPLFGSVIFQQLYNIADSFVAGKFVSEDALAAVGNSYEITLIFLAFAFGCNMGCSVIVSQLFGAKHYRDLKTAVSTALISSGILCAVLMAFGWAFSDALLHMIKTPGNIMEDSALYLNIYILGLPFLFFYNISTGIFTAMGDSGTPFRFLAVSSVANIGVDILFTTVLSPLFPRGVDGVAWATFLCQGVSCVLAVYFVFRRLRRIETPGSYPLFSGRLLARIAVVAIPSILQQSFISVGNIIIQGVINSFHSSVIAGYSAAIKLNNLLISSVMTMGNGISNFTAQNLGAGRIPRLHEGFRAGLKMVWMICIPFVLLYVFLGRSLLFIFLDNPTGTAMDTGAMFLMIIAPFYPVVSAKLVSDGVLRGAGKMNQFMIGTFSDLILRVVLAIVLSAKFGTNGIWASWPIGWSVATVMSLVFYKTANYEKT